MTRAQADDLRHSDAVAGDEAAEDGRTDPSCGHRLGLEAQKTTAAVIGWEGARTSGVRRRQWRWTEEGAAHRQTGPGRRVKRAEQKRCYSFRDGVRCCFLETARALGQTITFR